MNKRFPVLTFVSAVLRALGWLVVAGGLVALVVGLGTFRQGGLAALLAGAGALVCGLVTVAIGEGIGVLFAIEANTREGVGANRTGRTETRSKPTSQPRLGPRESGLQLLRVEAGRENVVFAERREETWVCICGTENLYDQGKSVQNCKACQTNRDFALTNWTENAMRAKAVTSTQKGAV